MNNNIQFKTRSKIIIYSLLCLVLMMVYKPCESQERNQELERQRLRSEALINRANNQLNIVAERHRILHDEVREMEIIKEGERPIYKVTLLIQHTTKRLHDCEIDINVSKEQYDKLIINQKIKLSGYQAYAFNIIVKNKVITK